MMKFRFLFFLILVSFSSCLDLDEEKREREAKYGPDSLQKPPVSPLDTVFLIHISDDYLNVSGVNFAYHITWTQVDSLLKYSLTKKPGLTVYVEELGSDPKMVDTAEDILIRNNIHEYTRFTNPKYPVFSKKFIEEKK